MSSTGPMGAPQQPNQQPDPHAPGQNVIAPPGVVSGAPGVAGPPASVGQQSNTVLQPPASSGSVLDPPPNFVDTPVMLTQPGAVEAPPVQPPAIANQVPQVQFGDKTQTVNAPADANKLPAGNAKDGVDAVWPGVNPNLQKDNNAAEVGDILKNAAGEAVIGLAKEGPAGAFTEGGLALVKEGLPWMGEKWIQDLKQNKRLPELVANYPAGLRDAVADWAGVGRSTQDNHYLDRGGDYYGASYGFMKNTLDNLEPKAAGNLKVVMHDSGKRIDFDNMLADKINGELTARASQILK